MIIEISKISKDGSSFQGFLSPDQLGFRGDEVVRPGDDLFYDLRVELIGTEILIRGETRLPVECTCVRCGEIFSTTLEDSSFLRAYECKPDMFELDITEDLRESIILILPAHPVCRKDCSGLCSGCGKNLNRETCTCKQETGHLSWSELDNLKLS